MKSPFPGMDPYLEARWSNVHVLMMGAITAALNSELPPGLEARPEEEVRVETIVGERLQAYRADVAVVEHDAKETSAISATAVAEPVRIPYQHAPIVLRNIHVVDTNDSERIVTVIEVLIPWNKLPGKLNRQYVRKLHDFEAADTNWVEIDLLRSSRQHLLVKWADVPEEKQGEYLIITYRADDEKIDAYPILLREKLPKILIPLRDPDEKVALDLQSVFDRVYAEGRFGSIDYSKPPVPPLRGVNAQWAAELLAGRV